MTEEKKPKICDVCGKSWEYKLQVDYNKDGTKTCRHDSDCIDSVIAKKRHANLDLSIEAIRMADEHKRQDREAGINKQVLITSTQEGSRGKTETLPEKTVESIKEKVKNEEALQ